MPNAFDEPFWIGEHFFSSDDIQKIKTLAEQLGPVVAPTRLARIVCEVLDWKAPTSKPRIDSCRKLLMQMDRAGVIHLSKRVSVSPRGSVVSKERQGEPLADLQLSVPLRSVQPIEVVPVTDRDELLTWAATMAKYHPLGYQRAFGARQHYWIVSHAGPTPQRLGGILFGSAAKALAAREEWIGWDTATRGKFRARVVNNSRYLILPGVHVPHLASHALGLVARRIRADWMGRYGFSPVLLETFVELPYRGICYAAANWVVVGETVGRSRQDRYSTLHVPKKAIWMYPLVSNWRNALVEPWPTHPKAAKELFIQPEFF
jgi:hypothetical protein